MTTLPADLDLDMLAHDLARTISDCDYPIDVHEGHIRPHLQAFLTAALATAAADTDASDDAATWSPTVAAAPEPPVAQRGRRPRMTYMDWHRSQLVDLGATQRDEWFWQCPATGCKVWAGPYDDPMTAKKAGFEHVYRCEKANYHRRGRQS